MGPDALRGYNRSSITGYGSSNSFFEPEPSPSTVTEEPRRTKRPYVKKATNVALGVVPPTSPPQLADLAFNIHGWALEDGMKNRSTFEVINAYNATMIKGGFGAKIRELEQQVKGNVYRTDLAYTAREKDGGLAKLDPAVSRYLVIGYTFREDDPIYQNNKTFPRYSENELVGEARPAEHHVIRWHQCKTPILVVTPIKENTGTSIRLFGLVMPRSGLCQPVLLTHERIFYRWEYRASAGARPNQRNKNWNQVIIDKALSLSLPDERPRLVQTLLHPKSEEKIIIKVEDDEEDMDYLDADVREHFDNNVFELNLDLEATFEPLARVRGIAHTTQDSSYKVNTCLKFELDKGEIQGLLHAIRKTRNDRIYTEVEAHLHKLSNTAGIFPEEHPALIRFADAGYRVNDSSLAFDVGIAIKALWPYLAPMAETHSLMRIKYVINRNGQSIDDECLENVLRATLSAINYDDEITPDALQGRLKEVIFIDQVMHKSARRSSEACYREMSLGIDTIFLIMLLKDVLAIHEWQTQAKAHLVHAMPVSYHSQSFEHIMDLDISRLTVDVGIATLRWILRHAMSKSCDAEDVLVWLERLRLRIRQV